jgi:DNA ligase-1
MSGKKIIQQKLDGVRILTIVYKTGHVVQFSRNGKELVNFPHIKDQFAAAVQQHPMQQDMVFDGEIMSSSFQDLMKQVHRKDNVNANDATLHLFDMLPLTDFERGKYAMPQHLRDAELDKWFVLHSDILPSVSVLGREVVDLDTTHGVQRFNEINQTAIEGGFEGIMAKDPNAPYECKRTVAWLKLKPVITVDLPVVAVEEGTGKNMGKLGAFIAEGTDHGKLIRVNVGSGLTDNQREVFWEAQADLIGQTIEIKADAVTQNQDGSYSLRFPRFERFRRDK